MKRTIFIILTVVLLIAGVMTLAACDIFDIPENEGGGEAQIDNSVDLVDFIPSEDDDTQYIEGETYYTSKAVSLVTEVNGNYTTNRPFTLNKEDDTKRVYHGIYFYESDFFQVIYYKNINDLGTLYAVMSDPTDSQYAEVEYTSQGTPLQITVKQDGIYDLVLDTKTFAIDMVRVGDIDTPVYETVKSCELYVFISAGNFEYTPMTLNPETNEYYVEKEIPLNASIGFYNASHTGCYKLTVDWGAVDTLLYRDSDPARVSLHVGGRYKIYFNAKTYAIRLELQNPDTASYFCQVGWDCGNELTAVSSDTPYLFEYEFVAQGTPTMPYVDLPTFYPKLGMRYKLTVIDVDGFVGYDSWVTESGTYKLTVNLKDFTLTVEKLS